ncbi:class I SAM-dependent methyltransferase [Floridanema aerugineum]|uniref:Class I SAM-dependent methyltransferase n=1 Tax=Floridaenema aerugineum BLCC-F46 TaxID=3153654 RepID=A0ABV4X4Y5_9CYAN
MKEKLLTYEEAVRWMRSQPDMAESVTFSYLDADNLAAAKRFLESEEFSEVIKLLRLNRANTKLKILDIGCGNGIASYAFASRGYEVYAVDPDPSKDVGTGAIKRLSAEIGNGSISIVQAFAEALPFADSTFDIVYARQALHHFSDLRKGIGECSRVLKAGGLFLATREHVISDEQQLNAFLKHHILHKLHGGENAYCLEAYISALQEANLKILKCLGHFDTVINHFPAPVSNSEVRNWLSHALEKKIGERLANLLIKIPIIENYYRNRLSRHCDIPGRLYSFLCVKK